MPFSPSTAEQVVASVEAVHINGEPTDADFVSNFADIPADRASAALALAVDLGLLGSQGDDFEAQSPLCRFLTSALQLRAASALRIALESYEPFLVFRERLLNTTDGTTAARHTKTVLALEGHPDEIRDTLVSLGTYSQALHAEGGGQYRLPAQETTNHLAELVAACSDTEAAQSRIIAQLGNDASSVASRTEVIAPLADALLQARSGNPAGAVQQAGNGAEAFLAEVGSRQGANLQGAHGIGSKVDRIKNVKPLPSKLERGLKYLGDIRNAADHGPDPDAGNQSWTIRPATGTEYVFLACSLLASLRSWEVGHPPTL